MYLEIDGAYGEGGGQILRSALALSAILQQPIKVKDIRAGRKNPGLAPQHLTGVNAVAAITEAEVKGAEIGSQELTFIPNALKAGDYVFDVAANRPSAGAISLVFQAIALPLAFANAPSTVILRGGTHVSWSPTVHYIQEIFLPHAALFGFHAKFSLDKWGWYPKGGGEAVVEIQPISRNEEDGKPALQWTQLLERGGLMEIRGVSALSNLPQHVAQRQRRQVARRLRDVSAKTTIELVNASAIGQGTLVFLEAIFENTSAGFSSLGERGKRAEKVADEACQELKEFLSTNAAIDHHLADQLIPLMSLAVFFAKFEKTSSFEKAPGQSAFRTSKITGHLTTNIWVAEQFLPVKFQVDGEVGEPGEVSV